MTSDEEANQIVQRYADLLEEYEMQMRRAKTLKSATKRIDAAYRAEAAFLEATELKSLLHGMGITVHRHF